MLSFEITHFKTSWPQLTVQELGCYFLHNLPLLLVFFLNDSIFLLHSLAMSLILLDYVFNGNAL